MHGVPAERKMNNKNMEKTSVLIGRVNNGSITYILHTNSPSLLSPNPTATYDTQSITQ